MKSHKPLKAISHNFGHSFISLMNYINDDYFLGHLLKQAKKTNCNRLEVDIINQVATPEVLLSKPIRDSIKYWTEWFPNLVETTGSTMGFVNSASVTIEFDLTKSRPYPHDGNLTENPFWCEVKIIDDRGKEYSKRHEGWWFPES
jgi:hypothetical protein